ncbi:MAG: YiiX/YebB-like N1pC/P60 family cysteine hydrolase [Thermodesulfobacteriota bacterium]|nr:YiiX/YebB-like N1pC/P60 family cysteine hydrolase [Thermodesulfobacteriota bacterium]
MRKRTFIGAMVFVVIIPAIIVKSYFFHPKFYPLKSWFFAWAGDTRIIESDKNTISKAELKRLRSLVRPGDIFLNRCNYYISNFAIPGFWTHAGLYVGSQEDRDEFFSGDVETMNWVRSKRIASGNFDELLYRLFDKKSKKHKMNWREMTIIESISEGVVFSTFESGAAKDGIVVLRPRISKREMAEAIYKAFSYVNKPYDYNFDFSTDTAIACTELVYKVYEKSTLFPVNDMFGKPFSTANEIAEYCDANYGKKGLKLSLAYIFDGKKAYTHENDAAHLIFRNSWKSSLW